MTFKANGMAGMRFLLAARDHCRYRGATPSQLCSEKFKSLGQSLISCIVCAERRAGMAISIVLFTVGNDVIPLY